jgi:hypothetical protein
MKGPEDPSREVKLDCHHHEGDSAITMEVKSVWNIHVLKGP